MYTHTYRAGERNCLNVKEGNAYLPTPHEYENKHKRRYSACGFHSGLRERVLGSPICHKQVDKNPKTDNPVQEKGNLRHSSGVSTKAAPIIHRLGLPRTKNNKRSKFREPLIQHLATQPTARCAARKSRIIACPASTIHIMVVLQHT